MLSVFSEPLSQHPLLRSCRLTGQVGYALEGGFMNANDIGLAIDAEISRLQRTKGRRNS